ncbi:hypothetical protein [Amycolatopsis sp. NPDC051903]|uniref:hypothetical protein n=1 Tax=Amycolatopsis sp. NPDC051903 TaxID=3363936 RepID=UPI0037A96E02
MLTAVGAALIAAVASLVGVTLGAFVEPVKLRAARRAKLLQDRADRCAGMIEAATRARQHIIDLNVIHRRRVLDEDTEADARREAEHEDAYYTARAEMRAFFGLLVMSGPDELVSQGRALQHQDMRLHDNRFVLDEGGRAAVHVLRAPDHDARSLRSARNHGPRRALPVDPRAAEVSGGWSRGSGEADRGVSDREPPAGFRGDRVAEAERARQGKLMAGDAGHHVAGRRSPARCRRP